MKAEFFKMLIAALLLISAPNVSARTYLVAVGIGDYSQFPGGGANNLSLTVNDAKTIVSLYSENTSVDYAILTDGKATRDRIVRAMRKVFRSAGDNDIVVFYFSGHGYPGGFCAYDGKIRYSEIRDAMALSRCKNKMMFVDACRAGGIRVDQSASRKATDAAKKASVMLFLSSRNNENSGERGDMQNGIFTASLTEGLRGGADTNADKVITAKELFDYVSKGVARVSNKQHPVMWGNFNDTMPVMKW